MQSYPEWQQLKSYEGHIKRLKIINKKPSIPHDSRPKSIKSKSSASQSAHKIKQLQQPSQLTQLQKVLAPPNPKPTLLLRYKTQPILKAPNSLRSPLPLISDQQSNLIKSTLNSKTISLKQKQHLLQNYLLSRRILETKSVLKPQEMKRQFKFHKKISSNLSRSRNLNCYSQERLENFSSYEKERKKDNRIQLGEGRNYFQFKIVQILLIRGIIAKNPSILYNLQITLSKNRYKLRALVYQNLFNKTMRLNFKKSLLTSNPEITVYLSMMRENHEIQIGMFRPCLKNFQKVGTAGNGNQGTIGDGNERNGNQGSGTGRNGGNEGIGGCNVVYKIMKANFPVGTVAVEGRVVYYVNRLG